MRIERILWTIVLTTLLITFILPLVSAGSCIITSNNRCLNTTIDYLIDSPVWVPQHTAIAPDVYDGSASACTDDYSGTHNATEDNLDAIPACQLGCCCNGADPFAVIGRPDFKSAGLCDYGIEYRDFGTYENIYYGSMDCFVTCIGASLPPTLCGSVILQAGKVCCWDNEQKDTLVECSAEPTNDCVNNINYTISESCICGGIKLRGPLACCNGDTPVTNTNLCPAAPISCGNGILQTGEDCDADTAAEANAQCGSNEICVYPCTCYDTTSTSTSCGNGICEPTDTVSNGCSQAQINTDCPSNSDICTSAPPLLWNQSPTLQTHLDGTFFVNMSWEVAAPCGASPVNGYLIQRSSNTSLAALRNPDFVWTGTILTFTENISRTTSGNSSKLYYQLVAQYENRLKTNLSASVNVPNNVCPLATMHYCQQLENGKQQTVNCADYINVNPYTCEGTGTNKQLCTMDAGIAVCKYSYVDCGECNGVFASFVNDYARVSEIDDFESSTSYNTRPNDCYQSWVCYKDINETTLPLYQTCSGVNSCLDYKTQDACTNNKCAKNNGCVWRSNNGFSGTCAPSTAAFQDCTQCNNASSKCTQDMCLNINETCFFHVHQEGSEEITWPQREINKIIVKDNNENNPTSCYNRADVPCEWLTTSDTCLGTGAAQTTFLLNQSNYYVKNYSADILGHGKCAWINNQCWKDSNNDSIPDIGNDEFPPQISRLPKYVLDFTSPNKYVLFTPGLLFGTDFTVNTTDHGESARTCFERTQAGTCPPPSAFDPPSDESKIIQRDFVDSETGDWTLHYYGEDDALNVGEVKNYTFRVDATPPSIQNVTITTVLQRYGFMPPSYIEPNYTMRVSIKWNVSDITQPVICNGTLKDGSTVVVNQASNNLVNKNGMNFGVLYPSVPGGTYIFNITCIDRLGNKNSSNYGPIRVDTNFNITNPRPDPEPPNTPFNKSQITIEIDTIQAANCSYGERNTAYATMQQYDVTGGINHNATFSVTTGNYSFQTKCNISNNIIEGDSVDDIIFSIDREAPITKLRNKTGGVVNVILGVQEYNLTLNCTDEPSTTPQFGCKDTTYCVSSTTCTPDTTENSLGRILTIPRINYTNHPGGAYLCYQSNDNGGNTKATTCTPKINVIDLTPPRMPQFTITPHKP